MIAVADLDRCRGLLHGVAFGCSGKGVVRFKEIKTADNLDVALTVFESG